MKQPRACRLVSGIEVEVVRYAKRTETLSMRHRRLLSVRSTLHALPTIHSSQVNLGSGHATCPLSPLVRVLRLRPIVFERRQDLRGRFCFSVKQTSDRVSCPLTHELSACSVVFSCERSRPEDYRLGRDAKQEKKKGAPEGAPIVAGVCVLLAASVRVCGRYGVGDAAELCGIVAPIGFE